MSDGIKIPKGWRKVRTGAKARPGDKVWAFYSERWGDPISADECVDRVMDHELIIRRIRPQARRSASRSRNKEPHPRSRNKGGHND